MLHRHLIPCLSFVLTMLCATQAIAHEFWIQPLQHRLAEDRPIIAHLASGEDFDGQMQLFQAQDAPQQAITHNGKTIQHKANWQSFPTLQSQPLGTGLYTVVVRTEPNLVSHSAWQSFEDYLREDALEWVIDAHEQRGLPSAGFIEAYSRHAKSLITIGTHNEVDQANDQQYEFVVRELPTDRHKPIKIDLLANGDPRAGQTVTVFHRDTKNQPATRKQYQTDRHGTLSLPAAAGRFLISTVFMQVPDEALAAEKSAVWHSNWVSLTFEVPAATS